MILLFISSSLAFSAIFHSFLFTCHLYFLPFNLLFTFIFHLIALGRTSSIKSIINSDIGNSSPDFDLNERKFNILLLNISYKFSIHSFYHLGSFLFITNLLRVFFVFFSIKEEKKILSNVIFHTY